jgi:hypothetical protein
VGLREDWEENNEGCCRVRSLSGGAGDREKEMGGFCAEGRSRLPLLEVDVGVGVALAGFFGRGREQYGGFSPVCFPPKPREGESFGFLLCREREELGGEGRGNHRWRGGGFNREQRTPVWLLVLGAKNPNGRVAARNEGDAVSGVCLPGLRGSVVG